MSSDSVLQVKLLNQSAVIKDLIGMIMQNNNIKYEIVDKFTEAGLTAGFTTDRPWVSDTVIGCVHLSVPEETAKMVEHIVVIADVAREISKAWPQAKNFEEDTEKLVKKFYSEVIHDIFSDEISTIKKMISEQKLNPINKKVMGYYNQIANEGEDFLTGHEFLSNIIVFLAQDLDSGEALFRWNNGFGKSRSDYLFTIYRKIKAIEILCGRE